MTGINISLARESIAKHRPRFASAIGDLALAAHFATLLEMALDALDALDALAGSALKRRE